LPSADGQKRRFGPSLRAAAGLAGNRRLTCAIKDGFL
jgi:hypothetical protein